MRAGRCCSHSTRRCEEASFSLRIIGFDMAMMQALAGEFAFLGELAEAGKIAQGRFGARRQ